VKWCAVGGVRLANVSAPRLYEEMGACNGASTFPAATGGTEERRYVSRERMLERCLDTCDIPNGAQYGGRKQYRGRALETAGEEIMNAARLRADEHGKRWR